MYQVFLNCTVAFIILGFVYTLYLIDNMEN